MDDLRFWMVVASMGPDLATKRLSMVLDSLSPDDVRDFCLWVDRVEADLDTPAHHAGAVTAFEIARSHRALRAWAAPEEPCAAVFDDLRATVVALGRDAWSAVVGVPALLDGGWATGLGRAFLAAVAVARSRSSAITQPLPQPG